MQGPSNKWHRAVAETTQPQTEGFNPKCRSPGRAVLPHLSHWRPGEIFLHMKTHHLGLETSKPNKTKQNLTLPSRKETSGDAEMRDATWLRQLQQTWFILTFAIRGKSKHFTATEIPMWEPSALAEPQLPDMEPGRRRRRQLNWV